MSGSAEFTIEASQFADGGYDAQEDTAVDLQLALAGVDIWKVEYSVAQRSKHAPAGAFTPSSGRPSTPGGTVAFNPGASLLGGAPYAFRLRCVVNDGRDRLGNIVDEYTRDRIIVVRNAVGLRAALQGELYEYDPDFGVSSVYDDVAASVASINVGLVQGISALGNVASTAALDGADANIVSLTATGNITLTLSNLVVGKDYSIDFTQDATGGRTLTLAGFTPLVAGSFDVDPTADATTVLTFRVIRAGKVMLSAPPATLIQTNLIRSAQATDLTLMPGDYDSSGVGTRCVSFNVRSANASGKSGSWVTKCRDFGIVVDGWQYFATPGNPDTNPSVVQSCKDVFVIQRLGVTCGYWEVESLGAGDFYYSLTGAGSSFNVRGGAGNFFTVTSAGAVTLSPKAADLRLTADSTYKVKIGEAGTEVCWFSDEAGVSTIEGQSTTCFKSASGTNVRLQGNAVEIWDNVGPTKLATVDSAGGATTITEHQGIWINLGAIIIERPSTYRGFETPLVYHDLANGGARAFQSDSKGFAIGGATSVGQDGALKIPVLAGDPSGNPPAGFIYLYGKGTGVYSKNSSGTVVAL